MTELVITRGLPASGKTTCARRWVAEDRIGRVRINRDDLRDMIDDGVFVKGVTEARILLARDHLIGEFLADGYSVICDDTNLPDAVVTGLRDLAARGAQFRVIDLTDVPLETCLARNALREGRRKVPDQVIRNMHRDYIAS